MNFRNIRSRRKRNEKGVMQIVEAAYVFPIIFFILLLLIYMGNMFFLRAQIDSVAEIWAVKGAQYCADPLLAGVENGEGIPSVKELNTKPYRQLLDDMSDVTGDVEKAVRSELDNSVTFFPGMKPDYSKAGAVTATYENKIIYQTFSVDISCKVKVPLKFLWEKENISVTLSAHAVAPINDTGEFMRNSDMVVDYLTGTKVGNGIADAFKKVNDFVGNFAKKESLKSETTRSQVLEKTGITPGQIITADGKKPGESGSSDPAASPGDSQTGVGSGIVAGDGTAVPSADGTDPTSGGGEEDGEADESEPPPSDGSGTGIPGTSDNSEDNDPGYDAQIPRTSEEWDAYLREKYGDENVEWDGSSGTVITAADREKLEKWKNPPSEEQYLRCKSIYDNPLYYDQETGDCIYPNPETHGAVEGTTQTVTLTEGMTIDRYGGETGRFASPEDTPYTERALPLGTDSAGNYHKYKVIKDIPNVEMGEAASWFGEEGGAVQYYFGEYTIKYLLDNDFIVDITKAE